MKNQQAITAVQHWLDSVVVELNLCPFAARELQKGSVRFAVSEARTEEQLLMSLEAELNLLGRDDSIETTLLIHPAVLADFFDYNQFLDVVDALLVEKQLEGVFQVASFHPDYQFGGTDADDAENYTNRSPYPMLHILREESVARAIAAYPDVEQVPARNVACMNRIGQERLREMLLASLANAD